MSNKIKIGKVVIEKNSMKRGFINVMKTPTRTVQFPYMVANGEKKGPILTLLAGDYGRDYNGFLAICDLFEKTNLNSLSGTILTIPFLNLAALEEKSDFSTIDLRSPNLNRTFPGSPNGSPNARLVDKVFIEVISKSDFFILLEAGGGTKHHISTVSYTTVGNEKVDQVSENLARNFISAEYVYSRHIDPRTNPPSNFQTGMASKGIPSITADVGGETAEIDEKAVARFSDGVLNVMKYLKMIEGKAEKVVQKALLDRYRLKVTQPGIFRPKIKAGDIVKKAQVLGEVLDIIGNKIETITSPADGVIYVLLCTGPMHRMLPTVLPAQGVVDVATYKTLS